MSKRKFLIVEKNLVKAMSLEKKLQNTGAESIGIATDYVTSMLLIKDVVPDVVFISPNLTLEGEGLGVADEIKALISCDLFVFTDGLSDELKERFMSAHSYTFIKETDDECLIGALNGGISSKPFLQESSHD
jgi:hypothetical protein